MTIAALAFVLLAAQTGPGLDRLDAMVGEWRGASRGEPGEGKAHRVCTRAVADRFVECRTTVTYARETHVDRAFFSYDKAVNRLRLRQFHGEGFVNSYLEDEPLVFVTNEIENIAPGWRARETHELSQDSWSERFELAQPGKEFAPYTTSTLQRVVVANTSYTLPDGGRVLRHETIVDAPVANVWKAFTTPEEMRQFIAPVIALDLRPGGIWEASYDPAGKIGAPGNIQNEVLSFVPERFLSIRIKRTPPQFPHPEVGKSVWTVIWFEDLGGGKTRLTTEMLPWTSGPEAGLLYGFFSAGNEVTLRHARDYFAGKPVQWPARTAEPAKGTTAE